jgi:hypothetical protein
MIALQSCVFPLRPIFHIRRSAMKVEKVELKKEVKLLVLDYVPANSCNNKKHYFSTCFGLDLKTHKVLLIHTECNSDSTIQKGDFIKFIPITAQKKTRTKQKKILMQINVECTEGSIKSPLYNYRSIIAFGNIVKL